MGIQIDRLDGLASSTAVKGPCRVATTENITLSDLQTIDGVALADGDRVLVRAQTDAKDNGIYVASTGNWRRSKDFSGNRDVRKGTMVVVTDGAVHESSEWIVTTENPVVFDTSNITFIETIFIYGDEEVKTATYTMSVDDNRQIIVANSASPITFTLPEAANADAAIAGQVWEVRVFNAGSGTLTIDGAGAETINGAASIDLLQNVAATLWTDGTSWRAAIIELAEGAVDEANLSSTLTSTLPVIADSITAMKALTTNRPVLVRSYYGDGRGGGGLFVPDAGDVSSSDNGGTVIVRTDGMRMKRDNANLRDIDVLEWGVSSELADNTTRYDAIIAAAEDGAVIRWTKSDGAYLGHFVAAGKAFKLRGNGAVVTNVDTADSLIEMRGSATLLTTTSGAIGYGFTGFNLTSTAGIAANDLLFVEDGTTPNNTELIRVLEVVGGGINVIDMMRSVQASGSDVYLVDPIIGPEVSGFEVRPTSLHVGNVVSIWYADTPLAAGNEFHGTTGRAIDYRYCWAPKAVGTKCIDAANVDSGEGYGVALSFCREISIRDTYARGYRHAVDLEATYGGEVANTTHEGVAGVQSLTCVTPIHEGFGGNITIRGAFGYGIFGPCVQMSGQGAANPLTLIVRDMTVENVRFRSTENENDAVIGVYVQTNYAGLLISDVQVEIRSAGATLNTASSSCVRLNGQCHGFSLIQGLRSQRLMCGVFASVDGTVPGGMPSIGLLAIKDVFVAACNSVVWARGVKHLETYTLTANSSVGGVRVVTSPHNGITTSTNVTGGTSAVVT